MSTKIVGILNYTPDSFSDGGNFFNLTSAQNRIEELLAAGVDIIDIGATSTSYNKTLLTAEEEWDKLRDLFKIIAPKYGHLISIDTFYPENAQKAIDLGVHMINDVNGGKDINMIKVAARNKHIFYVFMYSIVLPANKNVRARDCKEIYDFAKIKLSLFQEQGVELSRVIFDPGIGFATGPELSLEIIKNLGFFKSLKIPIYIGHSRKSFLESITNNLPQDRDIETLTASVLMMKQGVDYLRVHNVDIHHRARKVYNTIFL